MISISSLHLIGAPEKIQNFNDEKEKLLERERKIALLQALEEKWKARRKPFDPEEHRGETRDGSEAAAPANTGSFLCRMNASRKGNPIGIPSLPP